MGDGESYDEEALEVGEGSAGEPEERAGEELAALEEQPPPSPEELERRQERFREVRRQGGPDLHAETEARSEAVEEVPDVPATEVEDEEVSMGRGA